MSAIVLILALALSQFLLVELVERAQDPAANVLAVTMEAYGDDMDEEEAEEEVGVAIPATLAVLGICFACCAILLAGIPPLSGFVGKFALLTAMIGPVGQGAPVSVATWVFFALLILSGLSAMLAMMRAGIRTFWAPVEGVVPRVLVMEIAPVAFLILLCLALTVEGGPAMRYMNATAQSLHQPSAYIRDVLSARPVPNPEPGAHK
jgi:multicomponent K+:H+ antiporter subunit D